MNLYLLLGEPIVIRPRGATADILQVLTEFAIGSRLVARVQGQLRDLSKNFELGALVRLLHPAVHLLDLIPKGRPIVRAHSFPAKTLFRVTVEYSLEMGIASAKWPTFLPRNG